MVNAGDNIRQLARRRQKRAIEKFTVAGVLVVAPALPYLILGIHLAASVIWLNRSHPLDTQHQLNLF